MKKICLAFLFAALFFKSPGQRIDDQLAIKKLLEKESATWRSGDVNGHASCWHIQPYSRILVSTGDTVLDIPPAMIANPSAKSMGKGGTSINSNYKMSIHRNDAWVSHDEESTSADGKKTYSYEIRLLEKIKGQWKLVGQSIHIYKRS